MDEYIINERESRLGIFCRRTVAYLLDTALLCAVFIGIRLALDGMIDSLYINIALNLITLLYFSVCESSSYQATIGKHLLGLIVTDKEGNPISFKRALLRNFSRYINFFIFGLGYITIFFTKRKQGIHDLIAKTCVSRKKILDEDLEEEDSFSL